MTKSLPGLNVLEYNEWLATFGVESRQLRRPNTDLCMNKTILFNSVNLNASTLLSIITNLNTSGHQFRLVTPLCTDRTRSDFFASKVIDVCNS